jgi:hypothetical protein
LLAELVAAEIMTQTGELVEVEPAVIELAQEVLVVEQVLKVRYRLKLALTTRLQ